MVYHFKGTDIYSNAEWCREGVVANPYVLALIPGDNPMSPSHLASSIGPLNQGGETPSQEPKPTRAVSVAFPAPQSHVCKGRGLPLLSG